MFRKRPRSGSEWRVPVLISSIFGSQPVRSRKWLQKCSFSARFDNFRLLVGLSAESGFKWLVLIFSCSLSECPSSPDMRRSNQERQQPSHAALEQQICKNGACQNEANLVLGSITNRPKTCQIQPEGLLKVLLTGSTPLSGA